MVTIYRKMALFMASLYALISIGVPVYQLHCACTGQSEITLLVKPEVVHDEMHNDGHSCCTDGLDAHSACCETTCENGCNIEHQCDEDVVKYIVFQPKTEPIVLANNFDFSPKTLATLSAFFNIDYLAGSLTSIENRTGNGECCELPPLLFASATELINFICQRRLSYIA